MNDNIKKSNAAELAIFALENLLQNIKTGRVTLVNIAIEQEVEWVDCRTTDNADGDKYASLTGLETMTVMYNK